MQEEEVKGLCTPPPPPLSHGISSCQYEVSVRVSKEELKSEIVSLRNYRQLSEHVLSYLSAGNHSELILRQLTIGKGLKTIANSLDSGPPLIGNGSGSRFDETDSSLSLEDSSPTSTHGFAGSRDGLYQQAAIEEETEEMDSVESHRQWTSVTSDQALIENFMALYFCWEYPAFAGFVKKHFLSDFKAGRDRYCSSLLVNAILALGSAFSEQLEKSDNSISGKGMSERFFQEAERLWMLEESSPSLTTIQGICLMSLREACWGREQQSWSYSGQAIRLAVEMGLNIQAHSDGLSVEEEEVRVATLWGACTLDQASSLGLGRLPHVSRKGMRMRKPILVGLEEEDDWVPYSDGEQPLPRDTQQPSNTRSVYRSFCELASIMHSSSYGLFQPGRGVTSQDLVNLYVEYLDWYNVLPEALRLGDNSTPMVLFVHMHYHFAIIHLFRPFIKLRLLSSRIVPRDICIQAANAISSLMHAYRQLYGLRRTPSFTPYIVLTSTLIHIITDHALKRDDFSAQTLQGILDLEDMAVTFQFARNASAILRVVVEGWEGTMAIANQTNSSEHPKDPRAILMPLITSVCPDGEHLVAIHYNYQISEYPLFSVFPAQGVPTLAGGDDPRKSGFELSR